MSDSLPSISIVVPTLNEALNLPAVCERVAAALAGRTYEIRIVDDNSKDNTVQVCAELSQRYPLVLMTRLKPTNGLGGAVLHGMDAATGDIFVCMDADLQHPPEKLPALIAPLEKGDADFTIGSRYVAGGTTQGEWGILRKINSQVATLLARPFAGRTQDPMSGFFALRRATYQQAESLTPLGYKIGLELMCKCRVRNIVEIPIDFATRAAGESKLSMKEQFRYLEHLSRLYDFCYPRLSPILKFLIVSMLGWLVGLGAFAIGWSRLHPVLCAVIGYGATIVITALFHIRYIRTQREFLLDASPWRSFVLIAAGELVGVVLAAAWVTRHFQLIPSVEFWTFCFGIGLVTRYVLRKELLQDIRGLRKSPRAGETH